MQNLGIVEVLIIAAVALLLFGGNKLPEFVRGVREAEKEFKDAYSESDSKKKKDK